MKYLAPYIFRVAISDRRIRSIEPGPDGRGKVTYDYRPVGTKRYKPLPGTAEELYVASYTCLAERLSQSQTLWPDQ